MPNIKEYTNPITDLHPNEAGYASAMVYGRRIGTLMREGDAEMAKGTANLFKPIGDFFKDQDEAATHDEISKGIVQRAKMEESWADQQNKIIQTSDPNDVRANLAQFQQSTVAPQAQSFMDGFRTPKGREYAAHAGAEAVAQQIKRSAADSAQASGDAVAVNLGQTLNSRANAAYKTPADLDHHLEAIDTDYNTVLSSTPLKPEQRKQAQELVQKAKQTTAYQGIMGTLDTVADPTAVVDDLISGHSQYLTGPQQLELRHHAEQRLKANQVKTKADDVEARRIEKDSFNQEMNSIEADIYKDPGKIVVTPQTWERAIKATNMPGATQEPGRVQSTLRFMRDEIQNAGHGPLQTSTDIYQNFASRMFLPATDPKALRQEEVYNARSSGMLNDHDFNYFREGINVAAKDPALASDQKSWHAFITEHKSQFTHDNPLSPNTDPVGHSRFAQWQRDSTEDMLARRQKGEKLRDIENDWISEQKMAPYTRGLSSFNNALQRKLDPKTGQMLEDPAALPPPVNPVVSPWKPGQSGADFLKQNGQ